MTIFVRHTLEAAEGAGAKVRRLMPVGGFMNFDPFVLWDHFNVSPGAGFPDHPHRGFEAITYLFEGGMRHTDNLGNSSTVHPNGAQRFTAGRGLIHSEMPDADSEQTVGIQMWVNLPKALKTIPPAYQQVEAEGFPEHVTESGTVRVIVGDGSPIQLHTPLRYLDAQLDEGGRIVEEIPEGWRGLVYVAKGEAVIDGHRLTKGMAGFFEDIRKLTVTAYKDSRLMVAFGQPHHEPIRQYGPFVD